MAENTSKIESSDRPCYNCEQRQVGCHSKCGKYAKYRERQDEIIKNRQEYYLSRRRPVNAKTKRRGQL